MFALLLACTGNLVSTAVDFGKLLDQYPDKTVKKIVTALSVALVKILSSQSNCKLASCVLLRVLFFDWLRYSLMVQQRITLKCKLKCNVKPMNNPLGVSPSKGNQGATRGKEKTF